MFNTLNNNIIFIQLTIINRRKLLKLFQTSSSLKELPSVVRNEICPWGAK